MKPLRYGPIPSHRERLRTTEAGDSERGALKAAMKAPKAVTAAALMGAPADGDGKPGKVQRKCGRCLEPGHYHKTCKHPNPPARAVTVTAVVGETEVIHAGEMVALAPAAGRKCGICRQPGHRRETCAMKTAPAAKPAPSPRSNTAWIASLDAPETDPTRTTGEPPSLEECARRLDAVGRFGTGSIVAEAGHDGIAAGKGGWRRGKQIGRVQDHERLDPFGLPRKAGGA